MYLPKKTRYFFSIILSYIFIFYSDRRTKKLIHSSGKENMFGKAANTVSVQGDKNSAWLWCIFGAKFLGGIIVAIGFALYFNQDKILYIPNPPGFPKTVDENPPFWRYIFILTK